MDELKPAHFEVFFHELHGYPPFPWQRRLAMQVCETGWPGSLDLPTASGKTAAIDVAVFAMALRRTGPRRVFFVVNRRVVVDAAFDRMRKIEGKLRAAKTGLLAAIAGRLREMAGGGGPLESYQLRGGIYRDDSWVRNPLEPALIASTVDQVGSRLLFRGYGVSDKVLPIHAALVANDALILLDEAHCSQAFCETLAAAARYREWAEREIGAPFTFVQMTATPVGQPGERFGLSEEDSRDPEMRKRLYAPKPARLLVSKARPKDSGKLAADLVNEALRLAEKPGLRRIAVMANRVKTARLACAALRERGRNAHLLIGRMRPIDRLDLPQELQAMLSGNVRTPEREPVFVVATQCLEVGADLDFDAVVTECASIDALVQRFGRLDRIGDLHASGVVAEGCVMIPAAMSDARYSDAIYGDALANTWNWLRDAGEEADFAICSEAGNTTVRERLERESEAVASLRRAAPAAPALPPAYLDSLAQTSPRPALEPDVRWYLHGLEKGSPEVQLVWRADLPLDAPKQWAEVISLCPPVSAEAMTVPLRDFCNWLADAGGDDADACDIEGAAGPDKVDSRSLRCPVLCWRGEESAEITSAANIRPGDMLVLAEASGGWNELGHIPGNRIDVAESARMALRRGWVLRLHPSLIGRWPEHPARERLLAIAADPAWEDSRALFDVLEEYGDAAPAWLRQMLSDAPKRPVLNAYPGHKGWVVSGRFAEADAGHDEGSISFPVFLERHLSDVARTVERIAEALGLGEAERESLLQAARLHDSGKADPRFQALLHGGDPLAARFAPRLLAKGEAARQSLSAWRAQWAHSGLPDDFRHELISVLLARHGPEPVEDELALHLIASHHGRCRPFAPVVADNGGDLVYNGRRITGEQRVCEAPHRLDSGVAERFWMLTRRYGWWGLAYLESLLRLADWNASQEEAAAKEANA